MSSSSEQLNLSFMPMTEAMLPTVLILENRAYPVSWNVQLFKDCLANNYLCNVLLQNDEIIGYYIVQKIVDEYHLLNLCVSPDSQGQGLGKFQVDSIIKLADKIFINRILLEVRASNKIAKNLYIKCGFHVIGKRKNYYPTKDGREHAFVMELALG